MNKITDTIIIGAGASGLFLATLLNRKSDRKKLDILIFEHNSTVASKVLISGGGKCNITNDKVKSNNYLGDKSFIDNILKSFTQYRLLSWLRERGLTPELRDKNQYFCKTSSKEIVNILTRDIPCNQFKLNFNVIKVEKHDTIFSVITDRGVFHSKRVIVASGGLSFPKIGASSIGYDIATFFGHTVNKLSTGLVGLTVQSEQFFFKSLAGISVDVEIMVGDKIAQGSLLFAHKGISGPAVLDASLYWERGKISINFLPKVELMRLRNSKRKISNLLGLPNRLVKALFIAIEMEDKIANQMSNSDWERLKILQKYSFAPAGTFGYSKAEVTKGGVLTDEIDYTNMMSKKVENLHFIGEVLDVTGELGGYNFQWAFSSAFVCAKAIE